MATDKSITTQTYTICHCGKCKVKCNKHGKRATCADCGAVRLLGTVVENGIMRHICKKCIDLIEERQRKEVDDQLREAFREIRGNENKSYNNLR